MFHLYCRNKLNAKGPKEKGKGQEKTLETERALRLTSRGSASREWTDVQKKTPQLGPRGHIMQVNECLHTLILRFQ